MSRSAGKSNKGASVGKCVMASAKKPFEVSYTPYGAARYAWAFLYALRRGGRRPSFMCVVSTSN